MARETKAALEQVNNSSKQVYYQYHQQLIVNMASHPFYLQAFHSLCSKLAVLPDIEDEVAATAFSRLLLLATMT
jgi:hypothetical protein